MQNDLSSGKPSSVLWRFCLPLFASMLFQQMYSIADSLIAGGLIGEDALAAVGNSYEITFIYLAFAFGANIGCSVIVSRLFGAGRHEQMKTAVYTSILLVIVMCVFLMSMGFIGNSVLLQLIRTPKDIFADSRNYLLIYTASLPFMFFYNLSTGIFSGIGDSRTPFLFLAISSTANVILDYVFVKFLHLGVPGIAWATLICQGISCILSMTVVFHTLQRIKCEHKPALFSAPLLKQILAIAIPSIFQQSFISVGNIILQRIINAFGTAVMAGYSASIKLNNLMVSSFTTLGNGISNYTSQNIGAQNRNASRKDTASAYTWNGCSACRSCFCIWSSGNIFSCLSWKTRPEKPSGQALCFFGSCHRFISSPKSSLYPMAFCAVPIT